MSGSLIISTFQLSTMATFWISFYLNKTAGKVETIWEKNWEFEINFVSMSRTVSFFSRFGDIDILSWYSRVSPIALDLIHFPSDGNEYWNLIEHRVVFHQMAAPAFSDKAAILTCHFHVILPSLLCHQLSSCVFQRFATHS